MLNLVYACLLYTAAPGGVNTLPELASLTVIPAVQGLAGQKTGYDLSLIHISWLKTGKSTSINAKDQPLPERWQGLICF